MANHHNLGNKDQWVSPKLETLQSPEEMREASGLRPLERRSRADETFWKTDGFSAFQQRR
jgi:hypothetical protein